MKSKNVAGTLAFLMGIFGVHRFYLGKRFLGIMHVILFFFALLLTVEENAPFILIPMVVALIDAILLLVMPQEEFDEKYNSRFLHRHAQPAYYSTAAGHQRQNPEYYDRSYQQRHAFADTPNSTRLSARRAGIQRFRQHDFHGAIDAFEQALEDKYEDPALHFNLACCYSMIERDEAAFFHLEKAVEFGFNNLEKIHNHDALAFLRTLPEFRDFVRNGYTLAEPLPPLHQPELLPAEKQPLQNDLLDQIIKLGNLRDKGILTEQEFAKQKKKLLGEG